MKQNYLKTAISVLKKGGIVALPTETVYALAVDFDNSHAVDKLYATKKRPEKKSTGIAVEKKEAIYDWVSHVDECGRRLIDRYWPGPLTIIFSCSPSIAKRVHSGNNSIAIRCSSSPLVQQLLNAWGGAVSLTSANLSGKKDALTAQQVKDYFGDEVYLIEDDDNLIGKPSTIVDLTEQPYRVLREGTILAVEIEKLL